MVVWLADWSCSEALGNAQLAFGAHSPVVPGHEFSSQLALSQDIVVYVMYDCKYFVLGKPPASHLLQTLQVHFTPASHLLQTLQVHFAPASDTS